MNNQNDKEKDINLLPNYHQCFVCGDKNIKGLQTKWYVKGNKVFSSFCADAGYVGYENVIHGGILSALLDEAMIWAAFAETEQFGVTAELSIRFLKPLHIGERCRIEGWVTENKTRIWIVYARIIIESGEVLAKGMGKVIPLSIEQNIYFKKTILKNKNK